jgi:hypothetical protein
MIVVLEPGDTLVVQLKDTDGEFIIEYGQEKLTVTTEWPDTQGRTGELYCEEWGKPMEGLVDLDWQGQDKELKS